MIRVAALLPFILLAPLSFAKEKIPNVCLRTTTVYQAISRALPLIPCNDLTADDLAKIEALDLYISKPLQDGDLVGLTGLKTLTITSTEANLSTRALRPLKNLENLYISGPNLDRGALDNFRNLHVLQLYGVAYQPKLLDRLTELRELRISTPIGDSVWEWLKNQTKIEVLQLPSINLTYLDHEVLSKFSNLRELELNGNKIAKDLTAEFFSTHPMLEKLKLGNVGIEQLDPEWTRPLKRLRVLDFSANPIRELSKEFFDPLTNLTELSLGATKLTHIQAGTFDSLINLKSLDLGANKLLDKIDDFAFTAIGANLGINLTNSSLRETNKAAFHGVNSFGQLPRDFDQPDVDWGTP